MRYLTFVVSSLLIAEVSLAMKRVEIPGYTFSQLTDNASKDVDCRVSQNGMITWAGAYHLPGARSTSSTDLEIFLWDGNSVQQVTDNDVQDSRCVVNDFGDLAWQRFGNDEEAEIFVRMNDEVTQVTNDNPGVKDRYPDISNNFSIVWGRQLGGRFRLAVLDALGGLGVDVVGDGYRPHINALDHIIATEDGIVDMAGNLIGPIPSPQSLGYSGYRRTEINDLDQLALEADPGTSSSPDYSGPRDILFWDGVQMRVIYGSPGPWVGRADLNAAGVIAFEGYGALPGSLSSPEDREIFVYDPEIGTVIQLTDDDVADAWPTVTEDGRIVWWGLDGYPGAISAEWDREIFIATPTGDADSDGVPNATDNCPLKPNALQENGGGLREPDQIGDACQCGDLDDDGQLRSSDVSTLRTHLANLIPSLPAPEKCGVLEGAVGCGMADLVVMRRALVGRAPAPEQVCPAALPWL